MPKKKETTETPEESILVSAAKAIGTAAGKAAAKILQYLENPGTYYIHA
jgi:hypothetical protein